MDHGPWTMDQEPWTKNGPSTKTQAPRTRSEMEIVRNATCTFCGCVCDDIELHAEAEKIVKAKNACSLGEAHFRHHTAERLYPDALIDGKDVTVEEAVEVAADILYNANMPLVYGLSNVT